jgi:hypothetical protein
MPDTEQKPPEAVKPPEAKSRLDLVLQRTYWLLGILVALTVLFAYAEPYLSAFLTDALPYFPYIIHLLLPTMSLVSALIPFIVWYKVDLGLAAWQVRTSCTASLINSIASSLLGVHSKDLAVQIGCFVWLASIPCWAVLWLAASYQTDQLYTKGFMVLFRNADSVSGIVNLLEKFVKLDSHRQANQLIGDQACIEAIRQLSGILDQSVEVLKGRRKETVIAELKVKIREFLERLPQANEPEDGSEPSQPDKLA